MQREARPREAFAARYRPGRPPGEREAVARRAGDFEDRDPAMVLPAGADLAGERRAGVPCGGRWPPARLRCQPRRALHADRRGVRARGLPGRALTAAGLPGAGYPPARRSRGALAAGTPGPGDARLVIVDLMAGRENTEAGQQRLDNRYTQRRDEYIRQLAHLALRFRRSRRRDSPFCSPPRWRSTGAGRRLDVRASGRRLGCRPERNYVRVWRRSA